MRTAGRFLTVSSLLLGLLLPGFGPAVVAQDDTRYLSTRITGTLLEPDTGEPLDGATIEFLPRPGSGGQKREAVTDANGTFVVEDLPYGKYFITIQTADGQRIMGVNAVPIGENQYEIDLKISNRKGGDVTGENEPTAFVAAVAKKGLWARFWREFLIFFLVVGGAAAAIL